MKLMLFEEKPQYRGDGNGHLKLKFCPERAETNVYCVTLALGTNIVVY